MAVSSRRLVRDRLIPILMAAAVVAEIAGLSVWLWAAGATSASAGELCAPAVRDAAASEDLCVSAVDPDCPGAAPSLVACAEGPP
jgi:hypothetical protein